MKSTPFGYVVALVLGMAIGIAIDDQLLQPAPAVKPAPVIEHVQDAAPAKPAPRKIDAPVVVEEPIEVEQGEAVWNPPLMAELPAAVSGVPKLVVDEPTFDFGTQESGTHVEHTFVLENVGTAPLTITKMIQTGAIRMPRPASGQIAAGARVELKATLSLAGQRGAVRREIIVHSDDPATPQLTLALVGSAEPRVRVDPRPVDFGQIDGEQPAAKTFKVSGLRGLTFNIRATHTSGAAVTAEVKTVTPGSEYEVTATISPPLKAGAFHGWIHLRTDQRGEYSVIAVPLIAHVGRPAVPPSKTNEPNVGK